MALAAIFTLAGSASAHTPTISASCEGVHLTATNYEADKDNSWSVTIGGVEQHGTFGSSFNQTFPVPQDGATTQWSATIQAQDGGYKGTDGGSVGPCGEAPPVDVCPNIDGNQPEGTDCNPVTPTPEPTPPPVPTCSEGQVFLDDGCTYLNVPPVEVTAPAPLPDTGA